MRIVYIAQHFSTPSMDGFTRAYEFGRRLVEAGHDVHVVCGTPADQRHRVTGGVSAQAGIVVHRLPVLYENAMAYRTRLRAFGAFAVRAAVVAARLEPDLVFATSTPLTVAIPAGYAAARRHVPLVMEIRDLWPEMPIALGALRSPLSRWAAWRLEAWAYRRSAHVIALTDGIAASIRRRFDGVPVTVIPNCADLELFADADRAGERLRAATPWLRDRPLIVYAGAVGRANGVEYLVRMAAELADRAPDVAVAVLGTGAMLDELRTLAIRLGVLDRNLFLLGSLRKTEVVAYLGACDLAMHTIADPVLHCDAANKVFDALAAGRPVGLNHGGQLADTVVDAGAGLSLPPADPGAAAAAAIRFLRDRSACLAARTAARRLARDRFARDLLFRDFARVLSTAAGTVGASTEPVASHRVG